MNLCLNPFPSLTCQERVFFGEWVGVEGCVAKNDNELKYSQEKP